MVVVLIGVEAIARLLLKRAVYERLYLKQGSSRFSVHQDLEIVLEELYKTILVFLAFAKHYLDKSSARKAFWTRGKSRFDPINNADLILVGEVRVAEAESKLSGGRNRRGYPLTDYLNRSAKPTTRYWKFRMRNSELSWKRWESRLLGST